jgi:hypothetical protein
LVPCLGSGNESEDWKKRLNGLHVEGEGGRLYVAETRVSGLESGEMDEVLWGLRWSTRVDGCVGRKEGEGEGEKLGLVEHICGRQEAGCSSAPWSRLLAFFAPPYAQIQIQI